MPAGEQGSLHLDSPPAATNHEGKAVSYRTQNLGWITKVGAATHLPMGAGAAATTDAAACPPTSPHPPPLPAGQHGAVCESRGSRGLQSEQGRSASGSPGAAGGAQPPRLAC